MAEQRDETVTPKTATVEPVEVTVAVRSNQVVTETVHVVGSVVQSCRSLLSSIRIKFESCILNGFKTQQYSHWYMCCSTGAAC